MTTRAASIITAPTQFLDLGARRYAFRRFGRGPGLPLLFLQHFLGTMDNWDPALVDALAAHREVILFDNAGIGRSSGATPDSIAAMAEDALEFLDGLGVARCDALGFSLGGMVAQQIALVRPSMVRRLILAGTAPRGGEDIMDLGKPALARHFGDPDLKGYQILQKIFFAPTPDSQKAGAAFIERLMLRQDDREPPPSPATAPAQLAAFGEWRKFSGERFAELKAIEQPCLVVNGVADALIAAINSFWLAAHLPKATLLLLPESGHGALFQYAASVARHVEAFLNADSEPAPI